MATKIRLVRKGKRNRPFYNVIVVSDEKDGRGDVIEILGYYDPLREPPVFEVKDDRVVHWLKLGAQPSSTVKSFVKKRGILNQLNAD
ncbi:MAG: 30S ribosomal protein S16 [Candidatus Omnitrophica bacterium]|nr:30S ribosomal protein S16 [Candidatus Omnitrophota bacterium]